MIRGCFFGKGEPRAHMKTGHDHSFGNIGFIPTKRIGALFSYASFLGWQHVVVALSPDAAKKSPWRFVVRMIVLCALACVIIKLLGLNVAVAVTGLLVSGAAVILEIVFEIIYARA